MPEAFWHHVWHQSFVSLWQPEVMAVTVLVGAGYAVLVGPLSRSKPSSQSVGLGQCALFSLMLVVLYATFGSPVDWLSDHAFFSVHMVEHVVDMMVLPPLFILGLPEWFMRWCVRWRPLERLVRLLTHPLAALLLFGLALSVWHMQPFYHWTLVNDTVHFTEHATMFVAALFFWWPVVSPLSEMPRLRDLPRLGYLFFGMMVCWPLFYALSLAPAQHTYYPFYLRVYERWGVPSPGLFALRGQQLGGFIMMGAMMVVIGAAAFATFFHWVQTEEQKEADAGSRGYL